MTSFPPFPFLFPAPPIPPSLSNPWPLSLYLTCMYAHNWLSPFNVDCIYLISGLNTWYWVTNEGAHPQRKTTSANSSIFSLSISLGLGVGAPIIDYYSRLSLVLSPILNALSQNSPLITAVFTGSVPRTPPT